MLQAMDRYEAERMINSAKDLMDLVRPMISEVGQMARTMATPNVERFGEVKLRRTR
jgi:hypothetical protein